MHQIRLPLCSPLQKYIFVYGSEGGNILEDMIKGYMMQHQNPFANKKKAKKSQKAEIK